VSSPAWRETTARWLRFNAVGGLGVAVQLGTLALLTRGLGWNYLWATAIAVEIALAHNFFWHERYTWADRRRASQSVGEIARRLFVFQAGNGTGSLAGNLLLMAWLAGRLHVPAVMANVASVLVCSLVNFFIGDRLIFAAESGETPEETVALAGMATAFCVETPGGAADLRPGGNAAGHAHEVALREREKQERGERRKSEAKSDARPEQERRERPQQIEHQERREGALELRSHRGGIKGHARQPI
jgi:putative flippase GtrA